MLKHMFIWHSSAIRYKVSMFSAQGQTTMLAAPLRSHLRTLALLAAVTVGGLWMMPSAYSDESDHELARQALQAGKVLPLRTVLDQVERSYNGQVIKVEFEHDDGHFIYELRLLHPNGEVSKLKVDAMDGRVLSVRKKGRN